MGLIISFSINQFQRRPPRSGASTAENRVIDRDRSAGPVDEGLFAGGVLLAHHHALLLSPVPVDLSVAAVAIAVGVDGPVLLPEQSQCDIACRRASFQATGTGGFGSFQIIVNGADGNRAAPGDPAVIEV